MIAKSGPQLRGSNLIGLLSYLYGPAKATDSVHQDPRLIATWHGPGNCGLEPPSAGPLGPDGVGPRDFTRLAEQMQAPLLAADRVPDDPVWHCALRNHNNDRVLTDTEWADIAAKVTAALGFDDDPATGREPVRWIAVRHDDHGIHLAAMLARDDGSIPSLWREFRKLRAACRAIEQEYGLTVTNSGDRTAAKRPTRAETEKAERNERVEEPRHTLRRLVRQAAAAARDPHEFHAELAAAGVEIHYRYSRRDPDQITGYAVALPGDTNAAGEPVYYGGRKLAADLTWPQLTARWHQDRHTLDELGADPRTMPGQRRARTAYRRATTAVAAAADHLAGEDGGNPDAVDDLAAGADAVLVALDLARQGRPRSSARAAAAGFEQAGRRTRIRPGRSILGTVLRQAARQLIQASRADRDDTDAWLVLAAELSRLAGVIAEHRLAQGRREQAHAARLAAGVLHTLAEQRHRPTTAVLSGLPPIDPTRGQQPPGGPRRTTAPDPDQSHRRRAR